MEMFFFSQFDLLRWWYYIDQMIGYFDNLVLGIAGLLLHRFVLKGKACRLNGVRTSTKAPRFHAKSPPFFDKEKLPDLHATDSWMSCNYLITHVLLINCTVLRKDS